MIYDALENAYLYADRRLAVGFSFLTAGATYGLPSGRYELGEGAYANVAGYDTSPAVSAAFEAHRRYIDIQALIDGEEVIQIAPLADVTEIEAYDEEKDIAFYAEPGDESTLLMRPGVFAVFYPGDAHRPGVMTSHTPRTVKKIVVKIPVE
jgi:YhcH/YjgK/YiaL family protein